MGNLFLTPEVVAREALMLLQNNLVMAELVHRDYADAFAGVGDTVSVRKPAAFVAKNFTGNTDRQDVRESAVPVKLDRFRDVTVAVTSKELSLALEDFSRQVVAPAMAAIAQAIDEDILAVGVEAAQTVVEATAQPENLADIAKLAKELDLRRAPMTGRSLVLHPEHKYRYALTGSLSNVSSAGNGQTLRDALLGRVYSLDTYMDQNAPGSLADVPGSGSFTVAGEQGAAAVTVSGGSVKAGDGFILGGYLYRFTADGNGLVAIDQPLMQAANGTAVAVNAPVSLAFHRNAIALVTRKLALPMGASRAGYAEGDGLGVRVVYDYDPETKTDIISFDVIYGVKALQGELICALKG